MKTLYCLTAFSLIAFYSIAQDRTGQEWNVDYGFGYAFSAPNGGMKDYIRQGHGFTMDFGLTKPTCRLTAGLEMSYSNYGRQTTSQEYTFPDGTFAPMNIVVNNNFMNVMAMTRFYLGEQGILRPYATAKAGYSSFRTSLNVFDPDDEDSCAPIDSDILQSDGTFVYAVGGGLRVDLASVFKTAKPGRVFFDLSSTVTQGGKVRYMSTDAPPPGHGHSSSTRSSDVSVDFINTQTMITHRHHVGYLYSSFVQMFDVRAGISWRLNPSARAWCWF